MALLHPLLLFKWKWYSHEYVVKKKEGARGVYIRERDVKLLLIPFYIYYIFYPSCYFSLFYMKFLLYLILYLLSLYF